MSKEANINGKKKHRPKKIGKINPILYSVIAPIFNLYYTRKYHITYDNEAVKGLRGPAIVVASHVSDQDHFLSALTLRPVRPTYIVSQHFTHNKSTAPLIKLAHVITKKMFTPDVSTIINTMRAKNENAVIVIFPEGRLSCYGRTLPLAEGTAELIKKLGVDLYGWRADGAGNTFPKWRKKGDDRIGRIHCSLKFLLTSDEVAERSIPEIRTVVEEAIFHDEDQAMPGVEFKSDTMAEGADKVLYKCPACLKEDLIKTEGDRIYCQCGFEATLDNYYKLHGAPFETMNQWFLWQQDSIDTETEHLEIEARLGTPGEDGYMDPNAGHGHVYIDKNEFRLKGVIYGEKIDYVTAPEKITAFPISPGDHIDVYHGGKLIYIYPEPDMRASVKWVCYLDKLMENKRAAAKAEAEKAEAEKAEAEKEVATV